MNPFIGFMLIFALLGLLDLMLDGKLGLKGDFESGLATMGKLSLALVGFYSVGVSFVQNHAEAISAASASLPFDPSLIVGCLLAADSGALPIALKMARTPDLAVFTGALLGGGIGMTIGYSLPIFISTVKHDEISSVIRGFIAGLVVFPAGALVGGLILGLPVSDLVRNMIPAVLICLLLSIAVMFAQKKTLKALTIFGHVIRIISYLFFVISMVGMFLPQHALVDPALVKEILYMVMRMVIVACGGMVLSNIVLTRFPDKIEKASELLGINIYAVMGLVISCTQSVAMLALFSKMDRKGQIVNAAFAVCGAYILGGQFVFVASLTDTRQLTAFFFCKLIAGLLAIAAAAYLPVFSRDT